MYHSIVTYDCRSISAAKQAAWRPKLAPAATILQNGHIPLYCCSTQAIFSTYPHVHAMLCMGHAWLAVDNLNAKESFGNMSCHYDSNKQLGPFQIFLRAVPSTAEIDQEPRDSLAVMGLVPNQAFC